MPAKKKGGKKKAEAEAATAGDTTPVKQKQPKPKSEKKKKRIGKNELEGVKLVNTRWAADLEQKREHVLTRRFSLGRPDDDHVTPVARKVKGKGLKLKHITRIAPTLKKVPRKNKALLALHRLVIGKVSKEVEVKKNLESFNGVLYDEDWPKDKLTRKVDDLDLRLLRQLCDLLSLDSVGTREELTDSLIKFLEKPEQIDDSPRKRASSPRKSPTKKRKTSKKGKVKRPLSAYMFFCAAKRDSVMKKHPSYGVTDVAKKLGKMWRHLPEEDRKPYEKEAKKDVERYKHDLSKMKKAEKDKSSGSESGSESESESESQSESEDEKEKEKEKEKDKEKEKEKEKEKKKKEKEKEKEKDKEKDKKKEKEKEKEKEKKKAKEEGSDKE